MFPSIPVELPDKYFNFIENKFAYRKSGKAYEHIPDIGILKVDSVIRVYKDNKVTEESLDIVLPKKKVWWIIDETIENQQVARNYITNNCKKHKNNKAIIVIKKNTGLKAVIDAKYVKVLGKNDIEKIIIDALMLGAEKCFLMTKYKTDPKNHNLTLIAPEIKLSIRGKTIKAKLFEVNDYIRPSILPDLSSFKNTYNERLVKFNKHFLTSDIDNK